MVTGVDAQDSKFRIDVPTRLIDGDPLQLNIYGTPGNATRIHLLRSIEKWKEEEGNWRRVRQPLHAFADFVVPDGGVIKLTEQSPTRGTYMGADSLGLLRSGYRFGDPFLAEIHPFDEKPLNDADQNRIWIKVEVDSAIVAESTFELVDGSAGLIQGETNGDNWHAVYAWPDNDTTLPVVISLHGSEGGSVSKAKGRAIQFASRGFACIAVNYFAYQYEQIQGVPTNHAEIELEILDSIYEWIKTQDGLDAKRISLYGVSKGAEFALLAATKYDWIQSVVAVVPSDIVWEGYRDGGGNAATSSWAVEGEPLPYVPLFLFDPSQEGLYRTNTERYDRSRAFHSNRVASARIPIEKTDSRILLLASDRDEVWASGEMARNLTERMIAAGKSDQVTLKIYPRAGHQISGTGTFPIRLYGEQSSEPDAKDLDAEGAAAANAWQRTLNFLREE